MGGAPRPGRGHRLPGGLRQLDPVALLMLLVDADRPEPVSSGARELALFLTPEPGAEAKEVEETIEGMLLRLEEFCSLTDMDARAIVTTSLSREAKEGSEECSDLPKVTQLTIRTDTSQILEENIPLLQAKVTEMRGVYAKVDQLEAFVKMVGHHVSFLEAHVLQAERDHGAFSQALRRWLGSTGLPSFRNNPPAPLPFELPALYRTEDYFPAAAGHAALQPPGPPRRRL
ncbi:breast carcinoma-amplified sequence 4 isoform X3 [Ursus maritimus]|uniref:Breast carcinoma-amplified sequence 4 isoform X3 n=1 Tax=Ursus maritimus TaxID=29073 RepID=A0A8M1GFG3_URSMA|nr:breast carcinoma-amplified sequence 4 isoform X3 [Ursus maritimus]